MCNSKNIAATGPFRVDVCSCGSAHVHLGPAMVRLDPGLLPTLADVITLAADRLVAPSRWRAGGLDAPPHSN